MTLAVFSAAVAASPRWVLNALTRLRVPRRYGEPLARRLALARLLAEGLGITLPAAWDLAAEAVKADPHRPWRRESGSGVMALDVDLPRFYTAYQARLALAREAPMEGMRGRRPRKRGSAIARARAWGLDTTLLESALDRTPAERLRLAAENMDLMRRLRGSASR